MASLGVLKGNGLVGAGAHFRFHVVANRRLSPSDYEQHRVGLTGPSARPLTAPVVCPGFVALRDVTDPGESTAVSANRDRRRRTRDAG